MLFDINSLKMFIPFNTVIILKVLVLKITVNKLLLCLYMSSRDVCTATCSTLFAPFLFCQTLQLPPFLLPFFLPPTFVFLRPAVVAEWAYESIQIQVRLLRRSQVRIPLEDAYMVKILNKKEKKI